MATGEESSSSSNPGCFVFMIFDFDDLICQANESRAHGTLTLHVSHGQFIKYEEIHNEDEPEEIDAFRLKFGYYPTKHVFRFKFRSHSMSESDLQSKVWSVFNDYFIHNLEGVIFKRWDDSFDQTKSLYALPNDQSLEYPHNVMEIWKNAAETLASHNIKGYFKVILFDEESDKDMYVVPHSENLYKLLYTYPRTITWDNIMYLKNKGGLCEND